MHVTKIAHFPHISRGGLTAGAPGQIRDGHETANEIEERPGDDDAVVDIQEKDDGHGGVADALEDGDELSGHGGAALTEVLAGSHLLEEDGDAAGEHGDKVDEEEGATAVLVAQVREAPHVAQAHRDRDAGEQKVLKKCGKTSCATISFFLLKHC